MKIARWVSYIALSSALCMTTTSAVLASDMANTVKKEKSTADKKNISKGDRVVSRVDGKEIKLSDVKALENALPPQVKAQIKDPAKLEELLIKQLEDLEALRAEAKKSGIENDADVKEAQAKANDQVTIQAFLAKYIKTEVTEAAVRVKYDDDIKNLPKDAMEVKARHILVKDEKTAKDIIKKLDNGADFMKLARDYSIDKGSAANGGDIGYFQKNEMVPEFVTAAFALTPGKYTKEPVKTQFGYHIIKSDDSRKVKPKKFEDEAERIQGELTEKAMGDLVKKLRSKSKIERFDQNGKPIKIDLEEDKNANVPEVNATSVETAPAA